MKKHKYDTLPAAFESGNTAKTGVALSPADQAYSFIDAAMSLPKEVFTDDRALAYTYTLNGAKTTTKLATGDLYDKALQTTIKNSYLKFEELVTTKLADDPSTGQALAKNMLDIMKQGRTAGMADDAIRARMGDYLFNLQKVEGIGDNAPTLTDGTLFYMNKKAGLRSDNAGPFQGYKAGNYDVPMRVVGGDPGKLSVAVLGFDKDIATVRDAWHAGHDLALRSDGTWSVNPASKLIRPTTESSTRQVFLNTLSGETKDTVIPTIADIATKEVPLSVTPAGVTSGSRSFKFSVEVPVSAEADSVEQTARHLWASQLQKIDGTISADDFSVLDRMSAAKTVVADRTEITIPGVQGMTNWRDLGNFDDWVFQNKLSSLQNKLKGGEKDITGLALELNTTPQWIQDAISSQFNAKLSKVTTGAPDLTSGWQRELSSYGAKENVLLSYRKEKALMMDDFGNTFQRDGVIPMADNSGNVIFADAEAHRGFITGQQAYAYRTKLAVDNLNTAFASVLGPYATRFIPFTAEELSGLADRTGSGATLVGASNANYGDKLKLWGQETGKQVHLTAQEVSNTNLTRLQPLLQQIKQDPTAAAELTAIRTKLLRSSEKFTLLGTDYGLDGSYLIDKQLLKGGSAETLAAIKDAMLSNNGGKELQAFKVQSQLVSDFLNEHMAINADIVGKKKVLYAAQGIASNLQEDTLYVPAIDTRKVPFFAFVRPTEGKIFGTSEVSMVTARSEAELLQLTSQIDPKQFDIIFKKDTERFFKARGDYDYSRALNESSTNSALKREGKLGDFLPSFNTEDTIEDFVNYHQRQATQLVRDSVSTKYAQTIAELSRLSEQYTSAATSKFESTSKLFQRTVADPYDDYIKSALDISKRSEFTLLHQTNEFLDALGTRAYRASEDAFKKAAAGTIDWQQANDVLTKYGLGAPFKDADAFQLANTAADRNLLKTALQKANMILSTGLLRFDFANSLINMISTPIMLGSELSSIRRSIADSPELVGKLAELTSLKVPGQDISIPSTIKLIFNAGANYWKAGWQQLLARYETNGDIKNLLSIHHEMVDDLSLVPKLIPSKYAESVDKWTNRIATATGNNFAEQFTRFVSADVMRQLTDPIVQASKMSVQEQNAFISIFVNRVQGNYIASQRPILFQGTLGSAVGLFQTYQFNMLQQLFRHIENRDAKTVAIMGALQTSVFGLNGLPMFEAINTNIIGNASINDGHRDMYSLATQAAGKELGDWMMYGTASALPIFGKQGPALYTRGDVNPRHPTIIPVTPMDIPAVDATSRFVGNLWNTGKKIAGGVDVSTAMLEGLEHNSISRPLAGLAQVLQGYSTTSKGSLIAANIAANNDLFSIGNASRLAGAKPLDESVAMNEKFRNESYKVADKERLMNLGEVVKAQIRGGRAPSDEQMLDFMGRYAASGGRVENFGKALQGWTKDANESVVNQVSGQMRSAYGQRMIEVMGGEKLNDFTTAPTQSPP